jgi:hypothetical protein
MMVEAMMFSRVWQDDPLFDRMLADIGKRILDPVAAC